MLNVLDVPEDANVTQDEPPFVEYCQVSQGVFAVAVKLTLFAVELLKRSDTVGLLCPAYPMLPFARLT